MKTVKLLSAMITSLVSIGLTCLSTYTLVEGKFEKAAALGVMAIILHLWSAELNPED